MTKQMIWPMFVQINAILSLVAALLLGAIYTHGAVLAAEATPFPTIQLPPGADILQEEMVGAAALPGKEPKLDSALAALTTLPGRLDPTAAPALNLVGGRVQVQLLIRTGAVQPVTQVVTNGGGAITGVTQDQTLLQGWLPLTTLKTIAAHPDVLFIRRPAVAITLEDNSNTAGAINTEGGAVVNSSAWHGAGWRGAGVKIGIIDGGFQGYQALLGLELPIQVTVKNFVDGETDAQVDGSTHHGTACAEIIHDLAPAAELYLVKIATNVDLEEAVTWLKDVQQVNLISSSLGWYNLTPGDGTGFFADLVEQARRAQITWVTAAGNDREAHWGGLFTDPENDALHNFNGAQNVNYFGPGNGDVYLLPPGVPLQVYLRWDDWSNVNQDYDLYLLRWNGSGWSVIASGINVQNGTPGQTPTEGVSAVTTGAPTAYGFLIRRFQATHTVHFEVFAPQVARLDEIVPSRSLANLADAPGAITVGAVDVNPPYAQEAYSAEGPTNGPGGVAEGGHMKPDLVAYANVSTTSLGNRAFQGTSAATPHVAGAAALVAGAFPTFTSEQVQAFLATQALDLGVAGRDPQFGQGRLTLGALPQPILSINTITVTEGNAGAIQATLTLTLSTAHNAPVSVHYATSDGSATAGSDYVAVSGVLTFPPGATSQTLTVAVNGDSQDEPDETFWVLLSAATNATLAVEQAQVTILDDDDSPLTDGKAIKPGQTTVMIGSATWFIVHSTFTDDTNENSYTTYEYGPTETGPWTPVCQNGITGEAAWRLCTISDLTPNTAYFVRITHTDPDGVNGMNPVVLKPAIRTPSVAHLAVSIHPATITPQATHLLVTVPIAGDANLNSQLTSVEVAPAVDGPWTQKCGPYTSFAPKLCRVHGLTSGVDYWIRTIVSDPDGISSGAATQVLGPIRYSGLNNLAIGKSITADAGWGCCTDPTQLIDGRLQYPDWYYGFAWTGGLNQWAGGAPGWKQATVDLGRLSTIERVVWWTHDANNVPSTWKVEVSRDGVNYDQVFATTEPRCRTAQQTLNVHWRFPSCAQAANFTPVNARYVRYAFDDTTLVEGMHGWGVELEIFGTVVAVEPTITIVNDAQPDKKLDFRFTGSLGAFRLDDVQPDDGDLYRERKTFTVTTGIYTVTERVPDGWQLATIACDPVAAGVVDLSTQRVAITVAAGAQVTCRFTNQKNVTVEILNYHDLNRNRRRDSSEPGLADWNIKLYNAVHDELATTQTNSTGQARFADLRLGNYKVCAEVMQGWTSLQPSTVDPILAKPCYWLTLEPGQVAKVRFGQAMSNSGSGITPGPEGNDGLLIEDEETNQDNEGYDDSTDDGNILPPTAGAVYLPLIAVDRP